MSLLNAWIKPYEAIVAVDSDGVGQNGGRLPSSKLLVIPHLNVVLAVRGQAAFLSFVFTRCVSSGFDTFDAIVDAMPGVLGDADRLVPKELIVGDYRLASGNELIATGWSDRMNKMLLMQYVRRDDMTEFSQRDVDYHIAPWSSDMVGCPTNSKSLERLSRLQIDWMRRIDPNAACGGKLIVAR